MARPGKCLLLVIAAAGGCGPSMPRGFDSPEPAARMDAIVDAARRSDRSAVPRIVPLLDSDDPATRLLAIETLERLTGETFGYDYAAPPADRVAAVERWRRYVVGGGVGEEPGASGAEGAGKT